MTVRVRPIAPGEHREVGELTLAAYDEVGEVTASYREVLADVADRVGPTAEVLVAVDDCDCVLGTVTVMDAASPQFEHAGQGDGGIRMLAVAPTAQGHGVGRVLLDAAVERAREAGWRRIAITSMSWMTTAHRMYERAGFTRRPDLDVRFGSGVGHGYVLDLVEGAADHFPAPGPVPDEVPLFEERDSGPPSC